MITARGARFAVSLGEAQRRVRVLSMTGRGWLRWGIGLWVLGCGEPARDGASNVATPVDGTTSSSAMPSDTAPNETSTLATTTNVAPSAPPATAPTPPLDDDDAPPVVDCDTPSPGLGACWANDICREGADEFHGSVVTSVCIPGLGFEPADACTAFQLIGRCYDADLGTWEHHYYERSAPPAAEWQQGCEAVTGGIWCTGPLGVPDATSRECRRACDAARPDYTSAPECLDADSCFSDCLEAVAAEGGCAECVTARIYWESGGCNDFECSCPPATFN